MNSKNLHHVIFISLFLLGTCTFAKAQTGSPAQVSKINYTSFTLNASPGKVLIDWVTDNKIATNYFEIEKSSDGINFKTIAMVFGADPKQNGCDCYEGFDKPQSNTKKCYYRLKHVALNGETDYSETKMLALK